jgi:hypothetical protein
MVAIIGNTPITKLKEGSVLAVTGAQSENQAQREVDDFLQLSQRDDLGYFPISKDFFLLYPKFRNSSTIAL